MKTEYQNEIIYRLKKHRESLGFSQINIADKLGISYGQMGNIESPKQNHKYTLEHIYIICRYLKVPIEQIFLSDEDFAENKDIIDKLITNIIRYEKR